MQKTAQKRGLLNKLREQADISGKLTERYFNPEFKEIMDRLREMDDKIRAIATGSQYGEAPAPDDPVSLKSLLRSAKVNASKREYMRAVADLGRFHKKMLEIASMLSAFRVNVDAAHEKFLFSDLDDENKKHLQSFKERWAPKTSSISYDFVKNANILDFFTATEWGKALERNRALASWEKRYPNKVKELKEDTIKVINFSEKMLGVLLSNLSLMDKARSSRHPDTYIALSNKIIEAFKKYDEEPDKGFKSYYEKNIKGFLEKQEFFSPTKVDDTSKPKDLGQQDVGAKPLDPARPLPGLGPDAQQTATLPKAQSPVAPVIPPASPTSIPALPPVPAAKPKYVEIKTPSGKIQYADPITGEIVGETPAPTFDKSTTTTDMGPKVAPAHSKFYQSLEVLSEESPALISAHISKYARSIMGSDPETAMQLLQVAKSIKG